ncbi:MAG TPA: redoxin domain-containing protein [Thermomicrobiales bacterium]|jgi:hypothetical protein
MSTQFYVSYALLWLLVVFEAALIFLVYRHFGLAALGSVEGIQRDGLPIGEVAPAVTGTTAAGDSVRWEMKRGHSGLLLFASAACQPCATIMPFVNQVASAGNGYAPWVTAVVTGTQEEVAQISEQFQPPFPCVAEDGTGVFGRYRVRVTPFGFVIGEDGRILAKGLCSNVGTLKRLLITGGLDEAADVIKPKTLPLQMVEP